MLVVVVFVVVLMLCGNCGSDEVCMCVWGSYSSWCIV